MAPVRFTKAHKYRAKPVTIDGHRFPSQAEAKRYGELRLLEKAGVIEDLELQPEFPLEVEGGAAPLGVYRADFAYYPCHENGPHKGAIIGHQVVEDVKGFKTPLYRWKKKHVEAQYGISIVEITR